MRVSAFTTILLIPVVASVDSPTIFENFPHAKLVTVLQTVRLNAPCNVRLLTPSISSVQPNPLAELPVRYSPHVIQVFSRIRSPVEHIATTVLSVYKY
ncbi:hypothetical protein DAPPUDRAFT_254645 [Daphnia pulex]|uniref:Uncharacterized protein n=1 Tax=Daphnia pulex TaxID=6669 RepID=E9H7I9_DAPPU|nr:hypothetical protein DAPPUDRAFT_254645 [Daphnia pulex]|eukprot:EFX72302.1 hypothetical protein DAPPUDRAFT_254645 [Daphnia pulex]